MLFLSPLYLLLISQFSIIIFNIVFPFSSYIFGLFYLICILTSKSTLLGVDLDLCLILRILLFLLKGYKLLNLFLTIYYLYTMPASMLHSHFVQLQVLLFEL